MNFYNENDPKTAAWLRELIKEGLIADGIVDERSITEIKAHELDGYCQIHMFAGIGGWSAALRLAGWPDDRPVWTGSCPCQPFSTSGNQEGGDDSRHLWPAFYSLIKECSPATVFGEQVEGAIQFGWLDSVCGDLESCGYACASAVLRADSIGADHRRRRLLWVASDASGKRLPEQGEFGAHPFPYPSNAFGEADWLVSAFRRKAMPFLCERHDGVPAVVGEIACRGLGNAIVPQVAAQFILACEEAIAMTPPRPEIV